MAGRVPPQNLEAEQAVLGSILLKADVFASVLEIIKPQDFYKESHKLIFETMISLFENSEPQDVLTVSNLLRDTNQLEKSGGPLYLATLQPDAMKSRMILICWSIRQNRQFLTLQGKKVARILYRSKPLYPRHSKQLNSSTKGRK